MLKLSLFYKEMAPFLSICGSLTFSLVRILPNKGLSYKGELTLSSLLGVTCIFPSACISLENGGLMPDDIIISEPLV